jgi:uncharacterized protein YjeT (DUF2065 family)
MELYTERFVALSLVAVGLSHVLQPARWVELFDDLLRLPYAALVIGTLTLPLGLFVVLTHNVWVADWPVVVTVCGWGWTAKATLYMLRPRVTAVVTGQRLCTPRTIFAAGALFAVLGAGVTWHAFGPGAVTA